MRSTPIAVMVCCCLTCATGRAEPVRGIGDVLLARSRPRKVIARHDEVMLRTPAGTPRKRMIPNVPYFVFDENSERLHVWHLQDREIAGEKGGWVDKRHVVEWPGRAWCYPKADGDIARVLGVAFGEEHGLPPYRPADGLPWPILSTAVDSESVLIACNLAAFGGTTHLLPFRDIRDVDVYMMFSEAEIDLIFRTFAAAKAALDADRGNLPRLHEGFTLILDHCRVEFLDLRDIKRAVSAYPGDTVSFLAKKGYQPFVDRAARAIEDQLRWISRIGRARSFKNEEYHIMVVKKSWLDAGSEVTR